MKKREQGILGKLERNLGIRLRPVSPGTCTDASRLFRLPSGTWLLAEDSLTPRERALLALLLKEAGERGIAERDLLGRWVRKCLAGEKAEMPDEVRSLPWNRRVVLLMTVAGAVPPNFDEDLEEVCRAYFSGADPWYAAAGPSVRAVFVPLSALADAEEPCSPEELQSLLLQGAEGWAEAVASEAGRNVRVLIHPPVSGAEEAGRALAELAELERLIRRLSPERTVSGSWEWETEKLAAALPPEAVAAFLRRFPPEAESAIPELRRTLEAFFRLDLNVSETARHLYIHRNTLLYRLERFRQETGLDVRKFEEAVISRLWLVLSRLSGSGGPG